MEKRNEEVRYNKKSIKIIKLITFITVIVILICIGIYLIPLIKNISTIEGKIEFKSKIQNAGISGFFMLMGLELAQIIIAILPGEPMEIMAGMCYGIVGGTMFILFASFLSSALIFFLVKKLGKKFVYEFCNKDKVDKIENSKIFRNPKNTERIFLILFLIPGTPKDLLTYVAGLLPINPAKFLAIATFGRIPSIVSSTIAGANLLEGSWKIAILAYAVTFLIVIVIALLYKLLAKDQETEEAMKIMK